MYKLRAPKLVGQAYAIWRFQWFRRMAIACGMPGVQRTAGGDRWLAERSGRARMFLATGLLSLTAVVAGTLVAVAGEGEPSVTGATGRGGHAGRDSSAPPGEEWTPSPAASATLADAAATGGVNTPTATQTATTPAGATASPSPAATAAATPTAVASTEIVDRYALLEALPIPDDAWFEENPAGIDQAYTTGATAGAVIDLHDDYLRAEGWAPTATNAEGATWAKGVNQVILELSAAGEGQVRVYIRILP